MKLSIIVPVRDAASTLDRVLGAIARLDPPADETLVVDDASRDESPRIASHCPVRLIRLVAPSGAARARNTGAVIATGDVLLFIDSDVVLPAGAVGKVKAFLERSASTGAVVGIYSTRPVYSNWPSQYQNCFYPFYQSQARPGEGDFTTSCGAVRAGLFREVGGFDERIRGPTAEDKQLGWAIRKRGQGIEVLRDLEVEHLSSYSWREFARRELRLMVDLGKAFLRTGGALRLKTAQRHYRAVIASIPIVWSLAGASIWLVARPGWAPAASVAFLVLAFAMLNAPFWRFVAQLRGWRWGVGMAFTGAVDMILVAAALAWALFDYRLRDNRY